MKRQRIWLTALGLLAFIWAITALVMHETDHLVSWPGKVIELLETAPWLSGEKTSDEKRAQYLAIVIMNYQRLDNGQRRSLREDAQSTLDKFFESLTETEQKEYVDRTIEPLFASIDKGLKAMPMDERKRIIARMRGDMKGVRGGGTEPSKTEEKPTDKDSEFMESIVADDPMLFLREAPMKTKLELAPVLEDMSARIQGIRR